MLPILVCQLLLTAADPKPEPNPRQVAEAYLAAALGGKDEEAIKLAVPGKSPAGPEGPKKLRNAVAADKLAAAAAHASEAKGVAMVVTKPVRLTKATPDGNEAGVLVLELKKTADGWRVKDIDFRSEADAKKRVEAMRTKLPDTKEVPAEK